MLLLAFHPVPQPGSECILVRVEAAGVNRPDVLQRRGLYPPPPGASEFLAWKLPEKSSRWAKERNASISAIRCARWWRAAATPNTASCMRVMRYRYRQASA